MLTKQKMENRCSWNDFANYCKKQKTIIIYILTNLIAPTVHKPLKNVLTS